jgi:hypothetical protein
MVMGPAIRSAARRRIHADSFAGKRIELPHGPALATNTTRGQSAARGNTAGKLNPFANGPGRLLGMTVDRGSSLFVTWRSRESKARLSHHAAETADHLLLPAVSIREPACSLRGRAGYASRTSPH